MRLEVSATVLNAKSLRRNATSSTTNATVRIPASAYTERRPDSENSGAPARTPYSEATMPYAQMPRASSRHAYPSPAISSSEPIRHSPWPGAWSLVARTQELCCSLGGAVLNFDGHFVISEFRSPT